LLARRALRRASANLKDHLDSSIPIEHRNVIDELADLDGLLNSFMLNLQQTHPTVYAKVNAFTDNDKKFAFMFDFENRVGDLSKLNQNQGIAVNRWSTLFDSKCPDRIDLDLLENTSLFNRIESLYARPFLRDKLNMLSKQQRFEFAQMSKNGDVIWMNKLEEKPDAIIRWSNSPGQTKLIAKQDPDVWLYVVDDYPLGTVYRPVGSNSVKHEFVDLEDIIHFRAEKLGPPPRFNLEGLIKFKKLTLAQQQAKINEAIDIFRQGTVKYNTPVTYQGITIPISSYDNILGMGPDFKNLGMAFDSPGSFNLGIMGNMNSTQISQLQNKLTEPLSSIINKIKAFPEGVKVPIIENTRTIDYKNMWKKMGINPNDGKRIQKELRLDIHHVDDLDINLSTTLQIVSYDAHRITKSHSGSVKLNEIFFDLINNL